MNYWKYPTYRSLHRIFSNPMKYGVKDYVLHLYYIFRVPIVTWWERRKFRKNPNVSTLEFFEE